MPTETSLPPQHVAIIMDGNGRWAQARGLPRTEGHREGLKVAKRAVLAAKKENVRYLSLYTFSTENWKRAADEVSFLMTLIPKYLRLEIPFYREHEIRVVHSGNRENLPKDVVDAIGEVVAKTASFSGLTVNLAINYGGRDELVRAFGKAAAVHEAIRTEDDVRRFLDCPDLPDPDVIIRTGGEHRLSNFLLWQSAYTELFFSDTLWPDWSESDFSKIIDDYKKCERRFGGVK